MTKRAGFSRLTLALGLGWLPLAGNAQLPEKSPRVGLLGSDIREGNLRIAELRLWQSATLIADDTKKWIG
jgi:hypothetical protein